MATRRRNSFRSKVDALSKLMFQLGLVLWAGLALSATSDLKGEIVEVNEDFGNLNTDIPAAQLPLEVGQPFVFQCRDGVFEATFAGWYSEVPEG